jgi:periplasmic protein CpxP/Spy
MTSARKSVLKPLLLASLIAACGFAAIAQTTPAAPGAGQPSAQRGMMHRDQVMDPAKMQDRMAKREAALKEKLKITAAQEGAWTTFTGAMKPSADMFKRRTEMRAEMDKLSTPERIDKMKAMRAQRDAEMDKRAEAVKTFYAVLSPEQKKVFDAQRMQRGHGRDHGHDHGRG